MAQLFAFTPGLLVLMTLAVMPGTIFASSSQFRPSSGTSCICVGLTLPDTCVDRVSTSGDWPVTVSVSLSVATFNTIGMLMFCPTSSVIFSCTTVAKPPSSACTLYSPGVSCSTRYSPRASVTATTCVPFAMSDTVTVTPGSTALDSSVITPTMVACCAEATRAINATNRNTPTDTERIARMSMISFVSRSFVNER